jgi:methylisocitrate lyase
VLRARFAERPILLPGVFNGISAVVAAKSGAEGLYLSGAGITNASLGAPDIALGTLDEFSKAASQVTAAAPKIPVISDADTGFGESFNVVRTVIEMERAGLAGIHLEDQISPKRCGHLDGKEVVSREHMVQKVRFAVDAKRDPSFLIIARTDARGVEGLDSAIDRANAYVDAGADAIFAEGLATEQEFEAFRQRVKAPLLANMTEFGKTPILPFRFFADLGYEMVIYPMTAFRVMLKALQNAYGTLLADESQEALLGQMATRAELYDLIDYQDYISADARLAIGDSGKV